MATHRIQTTTELTISLPSYIIPANVEAQFKQNLDKLASLWHYRRQGKKMVWNGGGGAMALGAKPHPLKYLLF